MIISEKRFTDYTSVKKYQKKKANAPEEILSQKEMKERIKFAQDLHNKRAERIKARFSDFAIFQEGGSLENLIVFR